jgi:hypothetical protein
MPSVIKYILLNYFNIFAASIENFSQQRNELLTINKYFRLYINANSWQRYI